MPKTGNKIPRPLSSVVHASRSNEVLPFYYLYLGGSTTGNMYVFVLKDDISVYAWLSPTASACSAHAAETLA